MSAAHLGGASIGSPCCTETTRGDWTGFGQEDRSIRRTVARASIWIIAAAISLVANAELLMFLGHRPSVGADADPPGPAVVLVELAEPMVPSPSPSPAVGPAPSPAPSSTPSPPSSSSSSDRQVGEAEDPVEHDPIDRPFVPPVDIDALPTPMPVPRPPVPRPHPRRSAFARPVARYMAQEAVRAPAGGAPSHAAPRRVAASPSLGPSAAWADWKSQVLAAINREKRYPAGSAAIGTPTIHMSVAASGHVARVAVLASSGFGELDAAAVDTVRRTSPLPPPPDGAAELTFRMRFHLDAR